MLLQPLFPSPHAGGGGGTEPTPDVTPSSQQEQQIDTQTQDPSGSGEQLQGYSGNDGASLENVTDSNYGDIAKSLFGIDVNPGEGWTYKSSGSYNKVNDLYVTYNGSAEADVKAMMKTYYDAAAAVSTAGICGQEVDWDSGSISRTAPYADFETFYDEQATTILDFASAIWIYEYGGKSIQFSFSIDAGYMELSMVLMS